MTTELFEIHLDQIDASQSRARALDPGHAQGLADSIRMQGLIYPILVRKVGTGYRLVDGRHRLEAMRLLRWEIVPAILSEAESDDEALLDEVVANLARRMIALDFCQHLSELKSAWLRLHPETAHGGDRGNQHTGGKSRKPAFGSQDPEITAFDGAMAEKFDLGRTQIKEAVAIWKGLSDASRAALQGTKLAEKKTELKALSKEKKGRQAQILELILSEAHPDIQNVAEALFHLESGREITPIEKQFRAVRTAFSKLPDAALDMVVSAEADRVMASLKRLGRI